MSTENSAIHQLPLEKQLALRTLVLSADKMSHEQAIDMVKSLAEQLYLREEYFKQVLKSNLMNPTYSNIAPDSLG